MRRGGPEPADCCCLAQRVASVGRYVFWGWLTLLPILVVFAVTQRRAELEQIGAAFWAADRRWIAVGVGLEACSVVAAAWIYSYLLGRLGYRLPGRSLASIHLQRCAAGAVSPLSGPTSVYVFVEYLGRRRVPTHDALLAVGLRSLAGQVASVLILVLGLALIRPAALLPLVGGAVATLAVAATIFRSRPAVLPKARARLAVPRLPRVVRSLLMRLGERFRRHRLSPRDLAGPIAITVATRLGTVALLFASLRAVGVEASIGTTVVAYFAALLAHATLPIFGGAGLVESATVAALVQSGVPADLALAAALLWRLIDFWLPLGVGLVLHAGVLLDPILTGRRPARPVHPARGRPVSPVISPSSGSVAALNPAVSRPELRWDR
jgi:glycosyltransferase 2 family protein